MIDSIKNLIAFKSVDKLIKDENYEQAMAKLNSLAKSGYKPKDVFIKRGLLCKKLLMTEDAYSDFTYVITNLEDKRDAYYQRMLLNFEIANFYEAIIDASRVEELSPDEDNTEARKIKFLSMAYSEQEETAAQYILENFEYDKYKALQFIFNETARSEAEDEHAKALKLLGVIDILDKDNPLKLFKEATIYGSAGESAKEREIMKRIDSVFPKYFISHFRFSDIFDERNLLETSFLLELKIFDHQNLFAYPMTILEGYKNHQEGHITDSKECFERAIQIKPEKPEAYVLLGQTLQLMSGYENPEYRIEAEENYRKALEIYERENLPMKAENMKRQIKHLNSTLTI